MAYRQIGMWEILEVLRRVARGDRGNLPTPSKRRSRGALDEE
jgi:hypothetical protein